MSARVGPRYSTWSRLTFVTTATRPSTTFVASHSPPIPTSTTAQSTATSANQVRAAAVMISKYVGGSGRCGSTSSTTSRSRSSSSSGTGSPFQARRSHTDWRCGLVKTPTERPDEARSSAVIRATEVFPFVPVTCTQG